MRFTLFACVIVVSLCGLAWGGDGDTVETLALFPNRLYAGGDSSVALTATGLPSGAAADVPYTVTLRNTATAREDTLATGTTGPDGHAVVHFTVPADFPSGTATLRVNDTLTQSLSVLATSYLFIETDKAVYSQGQTIQGRLVCLDAQLRPMACAGTLSVYDANGNKIFKDTVEAEGSGIAPFEIPLAEQVNFGDWRIEVITTSYRQVSVTVKVERYVLPKFSVQVVPEKETFLLSESLTGSITADYFFGQPVQGTIHVRGLLKSGSAFNEFSNFSGTLVDGAAAFTLSRAPYAAYGSDNVAIEATVTDTTGHEETVTEYVTVLSYQPYSATVIANPDPIRPGANLSLTVALTKPQLSTPITGARLYLDYYDVNEYKISGQTISFSLTNAPQELIANVPENTAQVNAHLQYTGPSWSYQNQYFCFYAKYSPTASFLTLAAPSGGVFQAGDTVQITASAPGISRYCYVVSAHAAPLFGGVSTDGIISVPVTPAMAPMAHVAVYAVTTTGEVLAASCPLQVAPSNSGLFEVSFDQETVEPGAPVQLHVQSDTAAVAGLALVDESMVSLGVNEITLDAAYAPFSTPAASFASSHTVGASQLLTQGGIRLVSSAGLLVPYGESIVPDYEGEWGWEGEGEGEDEGEGEGEGESEGEGEGEEEGGLTARLRQFFPETWLWLPTLSLDAGVDTLLDLTAPDSITSWRLHAVSTGSDGLSISHADLTVFQDFFGEPDLPYAVTRGDRFPVRVQVFNYVSSPQSVVVSLKPDTWFELLEPATQTVSVPANSAALASFLIRPGQLGKNNIEVTLSSGARSDAFLRELRVEPEGVPRETVVNRMLNAGDTLSLDTLFPDNTVSGSEVPLLNITPGLLAQVISGLEDLLDMPYGCGEQNMMNLAPDIEVLRYLDATGQSSPEIREKALRFINAGYQRELTYQRTDGSFAAWGDKSPEGSVWLTAYVLSVFSDARDVYPIDAHVLDRASAWLESQQSPNGGWPPNDQLDYSINLEAAAMAVASNAKVLLALSDYGAASPSVVSNGLYFLDLNFSAASDSPYAVALATLAFARYGHARVTEATQRLLELAQADVNGLYWDRYNVECTAYAVQALQATGNNYQAGQGIAWLIAKRNSRGGFYTSQGTVACIRALVNAAFAQNRDVDLDVQAVRTGEDGAKSLLAEFHVDDSNFDMLQTVQLPADVTFDLTATGSGAVQMQLAKRFNVPAPLPHHDGILTLDVAWDSHFAHVGETRTITTTLTYTQPGVPSGMSMIEIGIPPAFEPVEASLTALLDAGIGLMNYEIRKRNVVLYFTSFPETTPLTFQIQASAEMPVQAAIPPNAAYLYYDPDVRVEDFSGFIAVELFLPDDDTDDDGLPNEWENENGLDFESGEADNGPDGDLDQDGLSNKTEYEAGTDPRDDSDAGTCSSADTDNDFAISMPELLRLIQLYNTGGYCCDATTEDGFAPGEGNHDCTAHTSDFYPSGPDWRISMIELLRLIQFYNFGGYSRCAGAGTEDGYCPGHAAR